MNLNIKARAGVYWAAYSLLAALIAIFALVRPSYNWDLLPYIGCVVQLGESDPEQIHRQTYALLQERFTPEVYSTFVDPSPYRRELARSPEAFFEQLPYYRIKPLYIGLLALGRLAGLHPVDASFAISILSALTIMVLIPLALRRRFSLGRAHLLGGLVSVAAGLPYLARLSSPDALSAVLLLGACSCALLYRRNAAAYSLLLLSILVRPDNLIFVLLFLAYQYLARHPGLEISLNRTAILGVCALLVYTVTGLAGPRYPHVTLVHHTFVGALAYPASFDPELSFELLYRVARKAVGQAILERTMSAFCLIGLVSLLLPRRGTVADQAKGMIVLVLLNIALRLPLFPLLDARFYAPHFVIIATAFLLMIATDSRPDSALRRPIELWRRRTRRTAD